MDTETKLDLVTKNTEEIITREEMKVLIETKTRPVPTGVSKPAA